MNIQPSLSAMNHSEQDILSAIGHKNAPSKLRSYPNDTKQNMACRMLWFGQSQMFI